MSEGLLSFIGIVLIASSVLQIILFFKVWGMTNNVAKLKDNFITPESGIDSQVRKYILMDEKEKAKDLVINHFINSIQEVEKMYLDTILNYTSETAEEYFKKAIEKASENFLTHKATLEKYLVLIGAEMPTPIKNLNSFEEYFNLIKEKNQDRTHK